MDQMSIRKKSLQNSFRNDFFYTVRVNSVFTGLFSFCGMLLYWQEDSAIYYAKKQSGEGSQPTQAEFFETFIYPKIFVSYRVWKAIIEHSDCRKKMCELLHISVDELLAQSNASNSNKSIQNEVSNLAVYEQDQIIEIIKIIKRFIELLVI